MRMTVEQTAPAGQFLAPNYFQVPVEWHDRLAEIDTIAELKVTLAIFRSTFGWHQRGDAISLTQIQDATGMGRSTVVRGIEAGLARGSFTKLEKKGSTTRYLVEVWFNSASPMMGPAGSPTVGPVASPTVGPTKETPLTGGEKKTSAAQEAEEFRQKVHEHWLALCDQHEEINLRSRDLTPSRARLIDKASKEASADECCAAVSGLFADEWYRERNYYDLSYVFNTKPGGKPLRQQIDRFIDIAERAGQGLAVTSADPDTINRAKRAVLAGYDLAGNEEARNTAERAESWLAGVGIEVDRSGERPMFKRKQEPEA